MIYKLTELANYVFDPLHRLWEGKVFQQKIAGVLVLTFLISLSLSELKRLGLLPEFFFSPWIKANPFWAVHLAFSLLLVFEVISFIFVLPCSVSKAVGKQLEILSLIFLRNCFKLLISLNEPISFQGHLDLVLKIGVYGLGALSIYVIILWYYRIIGREKEKSSSKQIKGEKIFLFVGAKKFVSLILLGLFILLGVYNLYALIMHKGLIAFFNEFYTILIFSDILIVLISHRFFPAFRDIFRNSSYAVATLLMRLCLTAPIYYDVLIGVMAAVFALLITISHTKTQVL
ncbi:MAG: hypothetical protein PWR24_1756 [Desulfonauticus sp.]|jgi:hypothetical protein|nr:MAG: hypothetical protein XD41_2130 [Desulfonauticus sp. 38_4375]MDK2922199.1 hypothetical protein [Desulfonauticus sp.]